MAGHRVRQQPYLVGTHAWGNRQGWPVLLRVHSTSTKSWFHSRNKKLVWRIGLRLRISEVRSSASIFATNDHFMAGFSFPCLARRYFM